MLGPPRSAIAIAGQAFLGLAAGLAAMATIELALVLTGAARLEAGQPYSALGVTVGGAVTALLIAAAQEGWVRGWLLTLAWSRWGFHRAAIGSSALFVLLHAEPGLRTVAPAEVALGAAGLFLFGLAAAASVKATGSIAWALGAHAGWDYVGGFLLGAPAYGREPGDESLLLITPDGGQGWAAGGAFGPEASPLAIVVLAAAAWAWLRVRSAPRASH